MQKIKAVIQSKNFLYVLLGLFIFQGIYFSAVINYKVPSDEEFHYLLTKYHAERPITAGPIINDQNDNFILGDIQRLPSYLYHYITSFYLRGVMAFTSSQETQVFMLRLVNVALGVMALLMLVSVFKRINKSQLTINLTIAWLTFTGMFVWVFAGLSYDNLSILLFFYLLYELIGLKDKLDLKHLLLSVCTALLLVLVKETYVPIVLISFLMLLAWHLKKSGIKQTCLTLDKSYRKRWKSSRFVVITLIVGTIMLGGLFIERYVGNYINYGKVTPTCNQVHTEEECMQNSIYRRNTGTRKEFLAAKQAGNVKLDSVFGFTKQWVGLIYERTYFYRGHQTLIDTPSSRVIASISAIMLLLLLLYSLATSKGFSAVTWALAIITIAYILLVFLYNLNTYHYYGYPFAIQGRYLLPILPFVYMAIVTALVALYRRLGVGARQLLVLVTLLLIVANLAVHTPYIIYRNGHEILDQPVISYSSDKLA